MLMLIVTKMPHADKNQDINNVFSKSLFCKRLRCLLTLKLFILGLSTLLIEFG